MAIGPLALIGSGQGAFVERFRHREPTQPALKLSQVIDDRRDVWIAKAQRRT